MKNCSAESIGSPYIKRTIWLKSYCIFVEEGIRRIFKDTLKDGNAVIDVAGGRREISMALSCEFGIPSIVIESKTQ